MDGGKMPYQQDYLPESVYDDRAFPVYGQANTSPNNNQVYGQQQDPNSFRQPISHPQSLYHPPSSNSHFAFGTPNYYAQQPHLQQQTFDLSQTSPVQFQQRYQQAFDSSTSNDISGFAAPTQFYPNQNQYYQQIPQQQQFQQSLPPIDQYPPKYQQITNPSRKSSQITNQLTHFYSANQPQVQEQWPDQSSSSYYQAPLNGTLPFQNGNQFQHTQSLPERPDLNLQLQQQHPFPPTRDSELQNVTEPSNFQMTSHTSAIVPEQPTTTVLPGDEATPNLSKSAPSHIKKPEPPSVTKYESDPLPAKFKPMRVEIPVQRISTSSPRTITPMSPKRRKSNDGQAVPVKKEPRPKNPTLKKGKEIPTSSPLTSLASSQVPPTPTPATLDYQAVLLGLSDEYIGAAYSMNTSLTTDDIPEEHLDMYHKLLAAGMGCLDSVLKNYRIADPRLEGRIRLRYANLLFEETENTNDIVEVVSKGVGVCERSRLHDLKYAMNHLLARVMFNSGKAKAAFKALERYIEETESFQLIHWTYAFRFLAVSLGLQMSASHSGNAGMVKQLGAIHDTAAAHGHIQVQVAARTIEALVHLRSRYPDSIEQSQRCLAGARAHQLAPDCQNMSQIRALQHCLDLACSLSRFNAEDAKTKMRIMHANMDSANQDTSWNPDGSWLISIGDIKPQSELVGDTCGFMSVTPTGQLALTFRWMTRIQVYELGYLLSGLVYMHSSMAEDDQKARDSLNEGLRTCQLLTNGQTQSLPSCLASFDSRQQMMTSLNIFLVFDHCRRSEWGPALELIVKLQQEISPDSSATSDDTTQTVLLYLEAVCNHGLGNLQLALDLYNAPHLRLGSEAEIKPSTYALLEIRVLSILNKIQILRAPPFSHQPRAREDSVDQLLARVEPLCTVHPNKDPLIRSNKALEAVYHVLRSTAGTQQELGDNPILRTKQHLQLAVQAAKSSLNNQLLCIVMNNIADQFFKNIVGNQAIQSVKAGRQLAQKGNNDLWLAVADRMYADTLERSGQAKEAATIRREGQLAMTKLPESLQGLFVQTEGE